VPSVLECEPTGVPGAGLGAWVDWKVWKERGEKVCRLLPLSGLTDVCLEGDLDDESRSVLFDCCTSGLVGGM
jgi:hypothetical protein